MYLDWHFDGGAEYCKTCRKAKKDDDCGVCSGQQPQMSCAEKAVCLLYNDLKRWGFSSDLFEIHGVKPSVFVLDLLSLIDERADKRTKEEKEEDQ